LRIAIIDLGTNTFNLLIVGFENNITTRIHTSKNAVKLGEGGFSEKVIREDAFKRGLLAFGEHMEVAKSMGCERVYAFATSAIRGASNGKEFIKTIYQQFKVKVDVINGDREAELIYQGVRSSGVLTEERMLIMDIGGGSTEFIIADQYRVYWKESFMLGAARVLENFTPSDPIKQVEISIIENHLRLAAENMFVAVEQFPVTALVGSSGSFDSIVDMIKASRGQEPNSEMERFNAISINDYETIHHRVINSTREERLNIPGLIPLRVDFIVIASIFIQLVMRECGIRQLWQSGYALKEGVVTELQKTLMNG
jgi:exopolyphosphatase/guanosine-5'-triphosphate,3'-diphosphate pyrophosphatase